MNIFYSSKNPMICAKRLDNKRVVKMCLETTQILCTVCNEKGFQMPYKSTHKHHPCILWAGESFNNFYWLWQHGFELCIEYTRRYGKNHKCLSILYKIRNIICQLPFEPIGFTEPPNCTTFKHIKDTRKAYKLYLKEKWKNDKITPRWYKNERTNSK